MKIKSNRNMTKKERALVKGAIRRVFSRSELRRNCIEASVVPGYSEESRPRVKKWSRCPLCNRFIPKYLMDGDHIEPVVPVKSSLDEMTWSQVVNRVWCDVNNLIAICKDCHKLKTSKERKERTLYHGKRK